MTNRIKQAQKGRVVTPNPELMKVNNPGLKIIAGATEGSFVIEDYTDLPHRGRLETQAAYKIRRKNEDLILKQKLDGKVIHASKMITDNVEENEKDPSIKHYFIDGDGTYRKPVKS